MRETYTRKLAERIDAVRRLTNQPFLVPRNSETRRGEGSYFGVRPVRLRTRTYVVAYFSFGSGGKRGAAGGKEPASARAARFT
jgi:hypothetical protein